MRERTVSRADARMIAETAADLADRALAWKAIVERFVEWVDRADKLDDDAAYLNGEHPEQRAADRNGWDDVRDIASEARQLLKGGKR